MATSLVVRTNVSGTSYSIDVAVLELDSNLSLKDFSVTHNGADQTASYTKTSQTSINYAGASVTLGVKVIVRRLSSFTPSEASFISTTTALELTNSLTKAQRRIEELDARVEYLLAQVALGGITVGTIPISDAAYAAGWDADTTNAPSKNAVYDKMQTMAPLASPVFTGDARAVTPATTDNDTSIATTAYVKANNTKSYNVINNVSGVAIAVEPSSTALANTGSIPVLVGDQVLCISRVTVLANTAAPARLDHLIETTIPGVLNSVEVYQQIPGNSYATISHVHFGTVTTAGSYTAQLNLNTPTGSNLLATTHASLTVFVLKP